MKKTIGIVGGGLLGMTLALKLREEGFQVSLIESQSDLGGLASPFTIGDYTWDQFYHVILGSDIHLLHLLEQLDLKNRIHWKPTKTGFFSNGHLYSMSNALEFLTFPPLNLLDKVRLGFNIFYASRIKSGNHLETITAVDWLNRLSGRRTVETIWRPLLRSKLGNHWNSVNASFIWATIARMYAARRSGLEKEMFGYVDEGYGTIIKGIQRLLNERGVETIKGFRVAQIVNGETEVGIHSADGQSLNSSEVILTTPCNTIADLCGKLTDGEKERFFRLTYQGVICPAFILKKPLSAYYITNITDEWVPFTGVIEMTAVVNKENFNGNSLIYLPFYVDQNDPLWRKGDKEIEEICLKALKTMAPSFRQEEVLAFKISRACYVFPITTVNYTKELMPATTTSLAHVFVVNSAQIPNGTMNVNEIVGLANRKAKELVKLIS